MNTLLKEWNWMRVVRLFVGALVAVYAISSEEYSFLILSALLLFQALLNVSCCGSQGCGADNERSEKGIYEDQVKKIKL